MKRSFAFAPAALDALADISAWTYQTFGPRQAEIYCDDLIAKCGSIAAGDVHSRNCSVLSGSRKKSGLHYAQCGQHFIVFYDSKGEIVVLDFIHMREDLPRQIAFLEAKAADQNP